MRKVTLALIICLSVQAGSLYAACTSERCKQAVAWKTGYTAIVLDDSITRNDYLAVLAAVKANKGVVAIEAERVLLGWVPITTAGTIRAARGVNAVLYDAVPRPADFARRDEALAALSFFNRVRTGEFEDSIEAGLAVTGRALNGCVIARPPSAETHSQSLTSTSFDSRSFDSRSIEDTAPMPTGERTPMDGSDPATLLHLPGVVSPKWGWFLTPYHNTQMIGRITVQLFRLDSDGTIDPNTYTWTDADLAASRDQVYSAFTFWVNQAAARGITLSFRVQTQDPFSRRTRSIFPTPTHYEPIFHASTDDYLWMNDALAPLGYGASLPLARDNVYTQNEAFNLAKAADPVYGPYDGSFSIFIVYNPPNANPPAPDVFADYPHGQRAYTVVGGPFSMVMWNSAGWGPNNLGLVITHETGHIFWACDEYYDFSDGTGCLSCLYCAYNVGPRNQIATPWVTNANCDNSIDGSTCDVPRTSCMMKNLDYALCPHTPGQIGW